MKFDSLILARSASTTEDNLLDIMGSGVTRVTADEFPWREPSLVAIDRFRFEREDLERDTNVRLHILAPSGGPIAQMRTTIAPDMLRQLGELPADEFPLLHVIADLDGIVFPQPGSYSVVTSIEDEIVSTFPLLVVSSDDDFELVQVDDAGNSS